MLIFQVRKQSDVEKIRAVNNAKMIPLMMDVTDHDLLVQAVATVKRDMETTKLPLVAVVNNAGISRKYFILLFDCIYKMTAYQSIVGRIAAEFHDVDDAKRVFDTNVFGVMALTQMTLPLLRESQGRIVMISSLAGSICEYFHSLSIVIMRIYLLMVTCKSTSLCFYLNSSMHLQCVFFSWLWWL
jgi:NAD(P)-dependent dehydrogenase (short-subunit alcohol dehydrogenase family)